MTIVHDSIAAQLLELQRLVPTPAAPLGYGRDLVCIDDLTPTMDEVDPFSTQAIAEATIRRLTTRRGGLIDDPDYGLDLRGYCNRGTPAHELAELGGAIRNEITKDDRIYDATVEVAFVGTDLRVQIRITPFDALLGEFSLTLAVTSAAVLLEALS